MCESYITRNAPLNTPDKHETEIQGLRITVYRRRPNHCFLCVVAHWFLLFDINNNCTSRSTCSMIAAVPICSFDDVYTNKSLWCGFTPVFVSQKHMIWWPLMAWQEKVAYRNDGLPTGLFASLRLLRCKQNIKAFNLCLTILMLLRSAVVLFGRHWQTDY